MKKLPLEKIYITSPFGMRTHPITNKRAMHNGVDLRGTLGTPVYAVDDGKVLVSKWTDSGAGHYITLEHDGYYSYYCHLSARSVEAGKKIKAGDVIGLVGSTGSSTSPHLHFGLCSSYNASRISSSAWFDPAPLIQYLQIKFVQLPIRLNGKNKTISAIEYEGRNYVQLRQLADLDTTDKLEVTWTEKYGVIIKTK